MRTEKFIISVQKTIYLCNVSKYRNQDEYYTIYPTRI